MGRIGFTLVLQSSVSDRYVVITESLIRAFALYNYV